MKKKNISFLSNVQRKAGTLVGMSEGVEMPVPLRGWLLSFSASVENPWRGRKDWYRRRTAAIAMAECIVNEDETQAITWDQEYSTQEGDMGGSFQTPWGLVDVNLQPAARGRRYERKPLEQEGTITKVTEPYALFKIKEQVAALMRAATGQPLEEHFAWCRRAEFPAPGRVIVGPADVEDGAPGAHAEGQYLLIFSGFPVIRGSVEYYAGHYGMEVAVRSVKIKTKDLPVLGLGEPCATQGWTTIWERDVAQIGAD